MRKNKMRYYGIYKNNKGFTLIEVMIAIVILTIGLLALVSVTVMVIKGNSLSKMMTTATTLAKDQLETIKNSSQTDDTSFNSIVDSSWSDVTDFPGYQWQQTVTTITGNSSCTAAVTPYACCTGSAIGKCPDRKNVTMKVRWLWLGIWHDVTLNTIITKK